MPNAKVLGIIPAHGGAKRIPGKNIKRINGKPLIAYSIDSAVKSRLLTDFVTSTDDEDVAAFARQGGSRVIRRPKNISRDSTPMIDIALHALSEVEKEKGSYEYLVLLLPTVPLRQSVDIDNAIRMLIETKADAVISVYEVAESHPARMYTMSGNKLAALDPKYEKEPSEDLPAVYHRNNAIYAVKRDSAVKGKSFFGKDCRGYVMPRARSLNILEPADLALAELILSGKLNGKAD